MVIEPSSWSQDPAGKSGDLGGAFPKPLIPAEAGNPGVLVCLSELNDHGVLLAGPPQRKKPWGPVRGDERSRLNELLSVDELPARLLAEFCAPAGSKRVPARAVYRAGVVCRGRDAARDHRRSRLRPWRLGGLGGGSSADWPTGALRARRRVRGNGYEGRCRSPADAVRIFTGAAVPPNCYAFTIQRTRT